MIRFFLIVTGVLISLNAVVFLLFLFQKNRAKTNGRLYEAARRRNADLTAQLEKAEAAEVIRQKERENAEEKIKAAYSGTDGERFSAINDGLRK